MVLHAPKAAASNEANGPRFVQLANANDPKIHEIRRRAQHELRVYRAAERIHALGPRPLGELLLELIDSFGWAVELRAKAYARLDAGFIKSQGGDRARPRLELVPNDRPGTAP